MYSINLSRPSIATFGGSACSKPCSNNRDSGWQFRMKHCFIAEVFEINEETNSVKSVLKAQCTGYRNMNSETFQMFDRQGYSGIIREIDMISTPAHMEATAIVDQVVIDREASIGSIIDVLGKFHCIMCQCLATMFGDFRYFGWYMNWDNIMPTVKTLMQTYMSKYETGDIKHTGNFFYKIPWNQGSAPSGMQELTPDGNQQSTATPTDGQVQQKCVNVMVFEGMPGDLNDLISQLKQRQ